MAIEFSNDVPSGTQEGDAVREGTDDVAAPVTVKRMRFMTQRQKSTKGNEKRKSVLNRFNSKRTSQLMDKMVHPGAKRQSGTTASSDEYGHEEEERRPARRVFFNQPLPRDSVDENGNPLQSFKRNKVRTARYTPLSFIPKNLFYQFQNVANIYFLFIIILGYFSIFGVPSPGLASVPLIVIVVLTAIKDAIEDWRRTMLDNELNNSPLHRLVDWDNVNASAEKIGLWRNAKKATSHGIVFLWQKLRGKKTLENPDENLFEENVTGTRPAMESKQSLQTMTTKNHSRKSLATRNSLQIPGEGDGIPMTPVTSSRPNMPSPNLSYVISQPETIGTAIGDDNNANPVIVKRDYGSIINPFRKSTDKARFKRDLWKNVKVGDFVRIYSDDPIPADVAVLATSDPDGGCYVETKNLDGETNLKVRQALYCGRKLKHARDCEKAEFMIDSEAAHANLYSYSGAIKWTQRNGKAPNAPTEERTESIGINNLLLRGCNVRNTEWVLGVVLFTGDETKIMLNAGATPSKRSRISRELNWSVIINFMILFVMCLVAGIVNGLYWGSSSSSAQYFDYGSIAGSSPATTGVVSFWTAIVLFQNLVPISLYISIEIIKVAQAFFIYSDVEMYYEKLDYPCTPRTWNISDDLGQIEYIFSDKTGTLTQNVMEFKKCTVNGVPYGEAYTEAQAGMQKRQGVNIEVEGARARRQIAVDKVKMLEDIRKMHPNPYLRDEDLTFVGPDFINDLSGASGDEQKNALAYFTLSLALCHTVVTERTPGNPPKIEFKAQSPDEAALVATAKDCGYTFLGRTGNTTFLNVLGQEIEYEVLNTLEFNSSRKRMSAIMRMPDGKITLFCKGADSTIYGRLRHGEQRQLRQTTAEHLEIFAREGLRTLCMAHRILSEAEYKEWSLRYDVAAASVENREDKLEEVSDSIERELTLIGGTAIEDRLQDGVPDTIALLAEAGIKLWVLTGDKVETAINIGFSCNLLGNDMDLINFKPAESSIASAEQELDKHLRTFGMTGSNEELKKARKDHSPPGPGHAIVIDGDALKLVLDETIRTKFLLLCKQCKAVLCCRVSPAQKADVVRLVKRGLDVMTLSIGDGANDVAMIQEADVGVGIAGEEGRQAVMSSDYAIGQFRFLCRLVLVHGRWSYRRLGETVANFFYKNMTWTFALFWYQIYCSFDGSYLYDYTYILLYNLIFTSIPIILMGILDQDVSDKVSLAVPQLYRRGIERKEWTYVKFWIYMSDGIYQSLIAFFMVYLLISGSAFVTVNGRSIEERQRIGIFVAISVVIINNLYILMNSYRWDWLIVLVVVISDLLIFAWTGLYTLFTTAFNIYKAGSELFAQLTFWAVMILIIFIALIPRFVSKFVQKVYFPRDIDIIRELVREGKFAHLDSNSPFGSKNLTYSASQSSSSEAAANAVVPISTATSNEPGVSPTAHRPTDSRGREDPYADSRPMYPPSITTANNTISTRHNQRSDNGSDGTEYTNHASERPVSLGMSPIDGRMSMDTRTATNPGTDTAGDRVRPSFDHMRTSMDATRPSFEACNDFTSAARLARAESAEAPAMSKFNYSRGKSPLR